MPSRRLVLLGLAGALGSTTVGASKKAQRKRKKGQRRMRRCFNNPEKFCNCNVSCSYCINAALDCCIWAYDSWKKFNRCFGG